MAQILKNAIIMWLLHLFKTINGNNFSTHQTTIKETNPIKLFSQKIYSLYRALMSTITQSFIKLDHFIIANIFIGATKWSCLPSEFVVLLLGSVSHQEIMG
jgi:hypothetical protein